MDIASGLFSGVFADRRLDSRCERVYGAMLETKSSILHRCFVDRAALTGSYRLMNNEQVTYEQVFSGLSRHWSCAGKHLLCLQDTSEANFSSHSGSFSIQDPDLGPLAKSADAGFFMHPSLCLDMEDGFVLGLSDLVLFNRRWGQPDKHQRRYQEQAWDEKESFRWLKCAQASQQRLREAAYVLFVADREADIYELLQRLPDEKSDVLVRLCRDRLLYQSRDQTRKMSHRLEACVAQRVYLPLSKSGQRQGRTAELGVKYTRMDLASPKNKAGVKSAVAVYVIEALEEPSGVPKGEEPICWRLVTSRPVESLDQAVQCLHYYSLRWRIEELFAMVKSQGMQLEDSRLASGKALKVMASLSLHAALQIIQLKEGPERQDKPARLTFTAQELLFLGLLCEQLQGKTNKQRNPYQADSLAYAAWVIARLGGWKGLQSQGKAGIKTMAWGLEKFHQLYQGYLLASHYT